MSEQIQKKAIPVGRWPLAPGTYDPTLDGTGIPDGTAVFGLIDENYSKYGAPESIPGLTKVASSTELVEDTFCVLNAASGFSYVLVMSHNASELEVKMVREHNDIEETIRVKLPGDVQHNALDFVSMLFSNNLLIESGGDGDGWAVGGTVGDSLGYMLVSGAEQSPGHWTLWLNSYDFSDDAVDDDFREIVWSHTNECTRCHDGWESCGGGDRMIFGKEFKNRCHSPLIFTNPDDKTLEVMKKLILMLKQRRKDKLLDGFEAISLTEIITLEQDIKVIGLSLEKYWPKQGNKIGDLWDVYSDEHRKKVNVKMPITQYGFWYNKPEDDFDYIVGSAVVEFDETGDEQIAFTIPAGRYIKDTFNALDFEKLVTEVIYTRSIIKQNYIEANGLKVRDMSTIPVGGIEVYPVQEMVNPKGKVTNEDFKQDTRITAVHPFMYTLTPVE